MAPSVSVAEVARHNTLENLWLVVDGFVYDMSEFAPEHPGGTAILQKYAGKDASVAYAEVHSETLIKRSLPQSKHIGPLDMSTVPKGWLAVAKAKAPTVEKPPLQSLINVHDFAGAAQKILTEKTWAFLWSGATDMHTKRRNADAYSEIGLRPRVLIDVQETDISTTVVGRKIRAPIFCSPTSLGKLFHPDGEKEIGRGCKEAGIPQMVSTSASHQLPEIVDAIEAHVPEQAFDMPVFFQLYVDKDRRKSEKLLREAVARGVTAVFITVDCPIPGKREADERMTADESIKSEMAGHQVKNDKKGGALGRLMGGFIDPKLQWSDLAWVRKIAPGMPIFLKGIQTWEDAVKAMEYGLDGILISNHGGRSLDTAPATILVLLELQKNCPEIFDKMEVYVDGGISRGTDIFKALCLGAKAVGLGRPMVFGLNYGREGIQRVVERK